MRSPIFALAGISIVFAATAVAGCGGGGEEATDGASGATVEMRDDLTFAPARVAVAPGARIAWHNTGAVPHDVVAESGAGFRSPTVREGGRWETTVRDAGTIRYLCTLHPGMRGTIEVRAE